MANERDASLLFADLAGYTALTQAHGDTRAMQTAMRFFELTSAAITNEARFVKTLGDGVMVASDSIANVISCARRLMQALDAEPDFPAARVGVHHGAVIEQGTDLFGGAVNLTARLMQHAKPGQVLCTEVIALAAARDRLAATQPLGTARMKNIAQPIAVYELLLDVGERSIAYVDPVCRMRVERTTAMAHDYAGTTFHFCSADCVQQFVRDPELYLDQY